MRYRIQILSNNSQETGVWEQGTGIAVTHTGPQRNGIYPEKGLLKLWPENGPDMLWSFEGLGAGQGNALMAYNLKDKKLQKTKTRYKFGIL